jgi:CRP-like cAMP-binding protein
LVVRRLRDGAVLSSRGEPAEPSVGVAKGTLRIGSIALSGQQTTLTYAEPGTWIGDISFIDGLPHTHDATAHGDRTLLAVRVELTRLVVLSRDTLQAIAQR